MAYQEELRLLSAVCDNKDVHVLFEESADDLFVETADIWDWLKVYYVENKEVPGSDVLSKHFKDFEHLEHGPTKYEMNMLRSAVLEESMRRMVRNAAELIKDGESKKALHGVVAQVNDISRITQAVRDIDVTDTESAISHMGKVRDERSAGVAGITTGFEAFDACLPMGINKGQLGIVLAFPARGKSWLMLYFAIQAWLQGRKPLILSLEMTEAEVRNRIYAILSPWSHNQISAGAIPEKEFREWADDFMKDKPPFKIMSGNIGSEVTPNLISAKIDQYKPDIVYIDYLQLMTDNNLTSGQETVKIKNLSRELKLMAVHESLPVVAITSATPTDPSDMDSVPQLGQVAWSRQISYDADWVLGLGRSEDSNVIEAALRKNRNGFMGGWFIESDFNNGKFVEIEEPLDTL